MLCLEGYKFFTLNWFYDFYFAGVILLVGVKFHFS